MPNTPLRTVLFVVIALVALALPAGASASRNLYLANGDNGTAGLALVFSLSSDGTPTQIQEVNGAVADGYFNAVSMSPDGKYLFMTDYDDNTVVSYSVAADGKLTQLPGSPKSLDPASGPYGTAVTPDGKYLVVGDYDRHGVEVLALGADGSLTQVPGGFLEVDPAADPYSIAVSTDSRFIYVPDVDTDQVFAVSIGAGGALAAVPGSPYPAGDAPYEAAVTPDGKYLYAPNYNDDNVSGYSIGADGSLTELAGSPFSVAIEPYGSVVISPDGRYLYTNREDGGIDAAAIAADGSLTVAAPPTVVGDYNPELAISPDGKYLYNGADTGFLTTYSVAASGSLTAIGTPLALPATTNPDTQSAVVSPNQPPVAALSATPGKGGVVAFDASGSTDPDGTVASYAWDFGDGVIDTTTVPTTSHTYGKSGDFTATVTLTDNEGCSTASIYTGQTSYCNGSAVAKATAATVADSKVGKPKVKAKKSQKQKGSLKIAVKAGADEAVSLVASGSATFKGVKGKVALKKTKGKAKANKTKTLKLKAKSKKQGKAVAGAKGKASIKVKFTDDVGNKVTKKVKVKLK